MVDRRSVAKWLPILLASCGGPRHADTPPPTAGMHAVPGDAGAPAMATDAAPGANDRKLVCWLTTDPRCADKSLPRIC
jgi:hypothetical protein